jgi:hypothetical protein
MSCYPGSPCYNAYYQPQQLSDCNACITTSDSVVYIGPNLPNSGVKNRDCLTLALEKIDNKLDPTELASAVLQMISTNPTLKSTLCNIISSC